jgi:hypothetical protein
VNNRNVSSVRSSQPSIRLAWARIDRRLTENLTGFALFGQDWSPFVSSTLPNMIENTYFGGIGFGTAYQRIPAEPCDSIHRPMATGRMVGFILVFCYRRSAPIPRGKRMIK